MLATCFSVLAFVADLAIGRGIELMLTIFILHICSSIAEQISSFGGGGGELNKVLELSFVAVHYSCIESMMFEFCLSSLRLRKKLVLPVSSCFHWMYRNCDLSSYLLDGRPGAAADVSNAVVTSCCCIACGNPRILLVAFLGV